MRHLVLSDLHENRTALLRAFDIADSVGGFDDIWFLGDALGHCNGASPCDAEYCLQELSDRSAVCVIGNWEEWFLHPERDAIGPQSRHAPVLQSLRDLLRYHLHDRLTAFISSWAETVEIGDFTLAHGSPVILPDADDCGVLPSETYLYPEQGAMVRRLLFRRVVNTQHLLVGHTHCPGYWHYNGDKPRWTWLTKDLMGKWISLDKLAGRFIINPGSASYADPGRCSHLPPTLLLIDDNSHAVQFLPLI